jgi:hypothetical protein
LIGLEPPLPLLLLLLPLPLLLLLLSPLLLQPVWRVKLRRYQCVQNRRVTKQARD